MTQKSVPTILAIEHESDSGPALLADRARELGFAVEIRNPVEHGLPASAEDYVALLVMGAAPSVYDDDVQHWFQREVSLINDADARGVPVFGVCFGAQAMSIAFGGSVNRSPQSEIGWYTITSDDEDFVPIGPWFQWHIDACTPPPEAKVFARTANCVQAFTIGPHLAVQFHPEVTVQQSIDWSDADPEGLVRHGLTKGELIAQTEQLMPGARVRASALFDSFCRHANLAIPEDALA
jgi:GMP synthase-like glutamine amidotransferase